MVIKGNARGGAGGGAAKLAAHLARTDTNEVMQLIETRGVMADDLHGALAEMEAVASGTRTKRPFYHASINTRADEVLTPEQRDQTIDRLEDALGLTGQPRVVVAHTKEGRAHHHVVWSRIDLDTMKAIPDSFNYRKHEQVSRDLEREFGHARVQGAHVERDGKPRPERTPSHAEMQQAERAAMTPAERKAAVTELWQTTDSGQAFAAAIADQGWILARGDKRDFVFVDQLGAVHSLGSKSIEGAKAKDVRARFADIDRDSLPDVEAAKAAQLAAVQLRESTPAEILPEIPPAPTLDPAPQLAMDEGAAPGLDHEPDVPAAPDFTQPEYEMPDPVAEQIRWEDEIAAAAIAKAVEAAEAEKAAKAAARAEDAKAVLRIDPNAIKRDLAAEQDHAESMMRLLAREEAADQRELRGLIHAADQIEHGAIFAAGQLAKGAQDMADAGSKALGAVGQLGDELMDAVDSALDFFIGAPPPRQISVAEFATDPAARLEHQQQQAAARTAEQARDAALEQMAEDRAAGRNVRPEDIRSLNRDDLATIKAKGDAGVAELIRRHEEERRREYDSGRERERERHR